MERVRALAAVGVEHHSDRERWRGLPFRQRAEIVGDALGQHRHDAVGEIDRVAAGVRLAVEGRAGPHVGRDIGDGDGDDMAARVVRVGSGSAWTASSWSLASGGSMVMSGEMPPILAALIVAASPPRLPSAPRPGRRTGFRGCGSRSSRPRPRSWGCRAAPHLGLGDSPATLLWMVTSTRSPSRASAVVAGIDPLLECFLSTGHQPRATPRGARCRSGAPRLVEDLHGPRGVGDGLVAGIVARGCGRRRRRPRRALPWRL